MKKTFAIFCSLLFALCSFSEAPAATVIKKAAPVATQKQEAGGLLGGNSLIPTALGLVTNVMTLSKQQTALTKECEPTSAEVEFVRKLMQEWARAAGARPDMGGRIACADGRSYANDVRTLGEGMLPCYNSFNTSVDRWQIYYNYPYPGSGYKLKDPSAPDNDNNRIRMSDMYELFDKIGFTEVDLLASEASQYAKLKERALECSPAKLAAKQKELWGNMLTSVIGGMGQKQDSGNVLGQVGGIMQQGGGSPLGVLGGVGTTLLGGLAGGQ